MDKVIKKYKLGSGQQKQYDRRFWQSRTIEEKLHTVEALRQDAIKMGLYPDYDENKQGLRRVLRIVKQK